MDNSYAHPVPRDGSQEETCRCGRKWTVEGVVEYGQWSPIDETDMNCPECGRNVLEDEG